MNDKRCFALVMVHPEKPDLFACVSYGYVVEAKEENDGVDIKWIAFGIVNGPDGKMILEFPPPAKKFKLTKNQFEGMDLIESNGAIFRIMWLIFEEEKRIIMPNQKDMNVINKPIPLFRGGRG